MVDLQNIGCTLDEEILKLGDVSEAEARKRKAHQGPAHNGDSAKK